LFDEAGVDFFKEARDGGDDRGTDFKEGLGDGVNGFDIGKSGALKNVDVIEGATVDVGERKEGERDVLGGIETKIVADVVDVGAKVGVREHDALRLASGTGSVDKRGELAGENLGGAHAIGRDIRRTRAGDECFVAKTFGGNVRFDIGDNDLFEFRKLLANVEKLPQLRWTNDEDDLGSAMFEDVSHAVGRFVEVDRDGDGAGAVDGEIGGVPFGAVGGKETDAIAGFHAEFDQGGGKAGDAAEKFLGGDGVPSAVAADHLGARVREIVDDIQEARGKCAVVHGLGSLYLTESGGAMERLAAAF
jgi:hypothetical protein